MNEKEHLKKCIIDSIKKIENMIKEKEDRKIIYEEKKKLDKLLKVYLEEK